MEWNGSPYNHYCLVAIAFLLLQRRKQITIMIMIKNMIALTNMYSNPFLIAESLDNRLGMSIISLWSRRLY